MLENRLDYKGAKDPRPQTHRVPKLLRLLAHLAFDDLNNCNYLGEFSLLT